MHHFFLSSGVKLKLSYKKLSDCKNSETLRLVSGWIEEKWGYIRHFPGIEKRMEMTQAMAEDIYILKYAGRPVGMFALHHYDNDLLNQKYKAIELTRVYIDKSFRGLGIFRSMMNLAKKLAKNQMGGDLIVLDTLDPNLNKMYERHGAKVLFETKFVDEPCERLRINL